ncbi:unnamed protein product [Nyctereutes procyonoides]|uniref:(raccoon dog) hypothetical protein n=1 Tax=Nyctereutes procyonoides TaxID=34880 RepID=A0A811Y8K0_NYCPR|nr:unnamed protein product [Nyctereutes procyonoides]
MHPLPGGKLARGRPSWAGWGLAPAERDTPCAEPHLPGPCLGCQELARTRGSQRTCLGGHLPRAHGRPSPGGHLPRGHGGPSPGGHLPRGHGGPAPGGHLPREPDPV